MLGIKLLTWRKGVLVGQDSFGNRYYRERKPSQTQGTSMERRWVIYKGQAEPSKVPAEWHGWLHHMQESPPTVDQTLRSPWQKPHLPNLSGTVYAYTPRALRGQDRPAATGDYTPWTPS